MKCLSEYIETIHYKDETKTKLFNIIHFLKKINRKKPVILILNICTNDNSIYKYPQNFYMDEYRKKRNNYIKSLDIKSSTPSIIESFHLNENNLKYIRYLKKSQEKNHQRIFNSNNNLIDNLNDNPNNHNNHNNSDNYISRQIIYTKRVLEKLIELNITDKIDELTLLLINNIINNRHNINNIQNVFDDIIFRNLGFDDYLLRYHLIYINNLSEENLNDISIDLENKVIIIKKLVENIFKYFLLIFLIYINNNEDIDLYKENYIKHFNNLYFFLDIFKRNHDNLGINEVNNRANNEVNNEENNGVNKKFTKKYKAFIRYNINRNINRNNKNDSIKIYYIVYFMILFYNENRTID
jgi:hypothetical protein